AGRPGDRHGQEPARIRRLPLRRLPPLETGGVELDGVGKVGPAQGETGRHSASTPLIRYSSTSAANQAGMASAPESSSPSSPGSVRASSTSQPSPYGSRSTSAGSATTAALVATTVPESGVASGPTNLAASRL